MTDPNVSSPLSQQRHIVICGSMSALTDMEHLADHLREDGFKVSTPVPEEESLAWETLGLEEAVALKRNFLNNYFDVIRDCDLVLIANSRKHGIDGYIGANTLMEAACGHTLGKPVVFFNAIGEQSCRVEAYAVSSGTLDGKIDRLTHMLSAHQE